MGRFYYRSRLVLLIMTFVLPMGVSFAKDPKSKASPFTAPDLSDPQSIKSSGYPIVAEKEGLFLISNPKNLYDPGTHVVLVRVPDSGDFEILANGTVQGQQGSTTYVEVNSEAIIKFPRKGDIAIIMADPWAPGKEGKDRVKPAKIATEPEPLPDEPGYIQYDQGSFSGSLVGNDTPNEVNLYKKSSFAFPYTHFQWYFAFVWQFGIELESVSGNFPTFSYYRDEEVTSADYSAMIFNYRFRRVLYDKLRLTTKLINFSDAFTTSNPDEAVISTTLSGTGIGLRSSLEFSEPMWKPSGKLGVTLQQVYLDLHYFPLVEAKDERISRGENSKGSSGSDFRIGVTSLAYIGWIPWIKRFVIEGYYGVRSYDLKYSGETVGPTDRNYEVPAGQAYKEVTSYWKVSVGVRLDDFIGNFFMPR